MKIGGWCRRKKEGAQVIDVLSWWRNGDSTDTEESGAGCTRESRVHERQAKQSVSLSGRGIHRGNCWIARKAEASVRVPLNKDLVGLCDVERIQKNTNKKRCGK